MSPVNTPTVTPVKSTQEDKLHNAIFIQYPHDLMNGVGILQLLNQLVSLAAQALKQGPENVPTDLGDVDARLSPCLRIAASIPTSNEDAIRKLFKDIQAQNQALCILFSIPTSSNTASPSHETIRRTCIKLPKPTSTTTPNTCKNIASGVSLTHVFTSALALTLRALQPRKDEPYPVRYISPSTMNLRPYCQAPYKSAEHAAATYHTVSAQALCLHLQVRTHSSDCNTPTESLPFFELIKIMRDFYKALEPAVTTQVYDQVMLAPLMFEAITPPAESDAHHVSDAPFSSVSLSSLGDINAIVAADHGEIDLMDVWTASEPIGEGVALFVGIWDSEIGHSAMYDTRHHDGGYIKRIPLSMSDKVDKGSQFPKGPYSLIVDGRLV